MVCSRCALTSVLRRARARLSQPSRATQGIESQCRSSRSSHALSRPTTRPAPFMRVPTRLPTPLPINLPALSLELRQARHRRAPHHEAAVQRRRVTQHADLEIVNATPSAHGLEVLACFRRATDAGRRGGRVAVHAETRALVLRRPVGPAQEGDGRGERGPVAKGRGGGEELGEERAPLSRRLERGVGLFNGLLVRGVPSY